MSATSRADRLTFDDTLFETMRRVLDMPVVSQTVWRFPAPLERRALERFHLSLRHGPLARRLVRARVPGARDHWVRANLVSPLLLDRPVDDLTGWIAARAATALSPVDGPTWALAYAPLRDGGSVLSFVTSHVVADGGLKLRSLEAAATSEHLPTLPSELARDGAVGSGPPGRRGRAVSLGVGVSRPKSRRAKSRRAKSQRRTRRRSAVPEAQCGSTTWPRATLAPALS